MTAPLTVGDRRRAALERLHGPAASTRTSAAGSARRSPSFPADDRRSPSVAAHIGEAPHDTRRGPRAGSGRRKDRPGDACTAQLGPPTGTYYAIAAVVGVFVMLGLVMVLSASAVTEANLGHSPYRIFGKQAMWAGLGLVSLVVAARYPYQIWRKLVIPLGVLGVIAMSLPFAPGLGANVNGASSWIRSAA